MSRLFVLACGIGILSGVGCAGHPPVATADGTGEGRDTGTSIMRRASSDRFGRPRPAPRTGAELAAARETAPAAALAFDPKVGVPEVPIDLSRERRQPQAFVGYDQGVTEHFFIRTDDRQRSGYGFGFGFGSPLGDRFERRAVTVKTGVRYR